MSNDLVDLSFDAELLALFKDDPQDNAALREGIAASFPVMSFRGKVWRVRYQDEAQPVMHEGEPAPAILCVIVAAGEGLSKLYFKGAYEEGSSDAPTCFSLDGVKPDPTSEAPQSKTCAACPHNVWGSKITPQGTKTKMCSDSRRLAVVPYPDLENDVYGGPMLLRVPPASFKGLVTYANYLDKVGAKFSGVVTRISFDIEAAFPKLIMKAVRPLTVGEYKRILELRKFETVERMLSASEATIAEIAPDPGGSLLEQAKARAPTKEEAKLEVVPDEKPVEEEPELPMEAAPEQTGDEADMAEAMAMLKAKREKAAKAKATREAKAAKAEATEAGEAPTATEAAAVEGVEVSEDLGNLLSKFNT